MSHTNLFNTPFLNCSNITRQQKSFVYRHTYAFLQLPQKLWAFLSKWQKWRTSNLNDESIIEQVAYEKMRDWRWKWMADRRVRRAPGGKNCSCVFTVTARIKLTQCLDITADCTHKVTTYSNSFFLHYNKCAEFRMSIISSHYWKKLLAHVKACWAVLPVSHAGCRPQ